jgi:7,8-dihydropterin-6-yl-methyl-4-(beta-D-ribofuranosyl)aminobenzene 5'-phosphate synthase
VATLEVKIVTVYNNEALPERGLKSGHGASYHITEGDKEILFDLGWKGRRLMHNIHALGIDVDKIGKLVLSHGHRDHTDGLVSFLKARTTKTHLPIIAHPSALEPKDAKKLFFRIRLGFPRLSKKLAEKTEFHLTKDPVEILPKLLTTGEIPMVERPEKPGMASLALHTVDGRREWDPVVDDLSLVLQAKDGLVIVTGCCHAGLLNTCAKATRLFGPKIKAIIGGTHMLEYSEEDVEHVADVLERLYGTPELYLNHCTGKKAIEQLRNKLGPSIVHDCFVGTELTFEV